MFMGEYVAVEQQNYLTPSEQVSRGMDILGMLGVTKENVAVEASPDVSVIVKHTFIEVVAPPTRMNRSLSDSNLPGMSCLDLDQPWDSEKPWKQRLTDKFQDFSDASTNVSLEAEDLSPFPDEKPERKDTCWSEDDGMMDMTNMASMYQMVDASWWMPIGYDMSTMSDLSYMAWGEGMEFNEQSVAFGDFDANDEEWQTTVMLRNMPNNYTRDMFLELVDSMGFKGKYDFAYLPVDFKSQVGLGYGFVNFMSSADAVKSFEVFEGFRDWTVPSEKVCTVTWSSPYQGLQVHIERYQNSPVMHPSIVDEWKPVLFQDGVRIPFPPPTKQIKTPKVRKNASSQSQS